MALELYTQLISQLYQAAYKIKQCYFKYFFSVWTYQSELTQYFFGQIYLYNYDAYFISNLIKTDKPRAIKLKNASRFIDDECNLNDSGEFSEPFYVISPNEVQLKCEDHGLDFTFFGSGYNCC